MVDVAAAAPPARGKPLNPTRAKQARKLWATFRQVVNKPLAECSYDDAVKLVEHIEAEHQKKHGEPIKAATVQRTLVPLIALVTRAIVLGKLTGTNPCVHVGANGAEYFLYSQRKKGNPLGIVYPPDGMLLVVTASAFTSSAPHPAAARLFTDFIFTKDIQQFLADDEGLYVPHPEVKYPSDKPKLADINLLTVDPEELERRTEEIKKRFVEFFGA